MSAVEHEPLKTSILRHLHDAVDVLVDPHQELSVEDAAACDRAFVTLLRLGRLLTAREELAVRKLATRGF
jgi:hypothetical protein